MPQLSQKQRYERCVFHVKSRSPRYNPWAVCASSVGRPSETRGTKSSFPEIKVGPKGGLYYIKNGSKVYLKKSI